MITAALVVPMLEHWLSTPVNGYFGSDYGADLLKMLLRVQSAPIADEFLAKLKRDIPILSQLDDDQLSLQSEDVGFEQKILYLVLGNIQINLNALADQKSTGETFDVDAG